MAGFVMGTKRMRQFGMHITGGVNLANSLQDAVNRGFTAAQIFLGQPQKFDLSPIPTTQLAHFLMVKRSSGIKVYVHAPYVLHAFAKPENADRNNKAVANYISMCDKLEMDGFVIHMGGTKWYEESKNYRDVAYNLMSAVTNLTRSGPGHHTPILFENCANGNDMSGNLIEICELIKWLQRNEVFPERIGLYLDTLHAWAWGYDYTKYSVINDLVKVIRPYIQLIHLNSGPDIVRCGGKYDRHHAITKGVIPEDCFRWMLPQLPDVPCIAERDSIDDVMADWQFVKETDSFLHSDPASHGVHQFGIDSRRGQPT